MDYNEWKVIRGQEPKPELNIQHVRKRRRRGKGKGVDSETVKGRSSGRGRREAVFVGSGRFHLWSKATQRPHTDTLRLFNNQHLEMGSNVELVWPESEAYSSRVNNCSHANSSLAAIRAKLSAEQLEQFKTSCFGHLLNIDKIQFSGQIVHGVVLRRVAGQGVKDLDGLSFLIGASFWEVPEVSSGESDEIRLQKRYFIDEGITCNALEEAFLRCTEEDDIYKLALVYFAELVVLGRDKHLNINLNYLTLVEDLDAFNRYPWGSVSFDKTQDSLFSAPTKYVKSFENEEGRGKGKSKVTGTSRRNEKGKKDKHGEAQRGAGVLKIWVYELIPRMADLNYCKVVDPTAVPRILRWRTTTSVPEMRKLNNYFFQSKESVQLRALCPSEEEMRQPYWSWPQDRPAVVSAESIPSSCADLDELNKVVSLLRSELFQVKREKDVLELKVIRMEKLLDHCLGPQFEQEVRRDLALLKERTNRCVISHLFKGSEEMDDIQWDEGPSNRNEGEEKEDEGIEGGEGPSNRNEGEEKEEEGIEGGEVQGKPSEVEEAQRKRSEGEQVKIKSSKGEEAQRKSSEGEEVKRKSSKGEELQRKSSEGEDPQRKRREGKEVKRQRSEEKEVQRNQCEKEDNEVMLLGDDIGESTEGTKVEFTLGDIDLDQPTAVLSHLVMQFGNVEAEIEFFASLVKADGWLKGDHIDLGLYLIRKRQQELEEVEISDWTTTDVSLIPDEILKEELAPLSITIPNLLNTIDFYEEGVYANNCSRDWWCPWPIDVGDCGMFVLKYIELLSAEIPLATCTSQNMPFFRLKLAAEITRGDAYMP
ncbi:hypothetical protein Prudu_012850 [Prunus dulcis]|uniref:BURP domain-containing protein n=1 Tax=Prunus dulcis TaxID=3755 RepID=A0A4Y1RDJ8_PRUDU|nr:hypothetical protein Prudu_012850 [Prunus dulcis]